MLCLKAIKRKQYASFFLLLFLSLNVSAHSPEYIVELAEKSNIYLEPTWYSLLHVTDSEPNISDSDFLLSNRSGFSLRNELIKTIQSFYQDQSLGDSHPICKFPARLYWLKKRLNLGDESFPKPQCTELNHYFNNAPAEQISLVFASENVNQPSSMMGHTFLKLAGINKKGKYVEHAVSYFTVINSYNIPKLLVQSTLTGMKGFFSLRPYRSQINEYLYKEGRNIWEYILDISDEKRYLIYLHIWELKDVKSKYLFIDYNCATVIHYLLSLAEPDILSTEQKWVTPKDVVKEAISNQMISKAELIPSNSWRIRMLKDSLGEKDIEPIFDKLSDNKKPIMNDNSSYEEFLRLEYIESQVKQLALNGDMPNDVAEDILGDVAESSKTLKDKYYIDLSSYKNPANTSGDSQYGISYSTVKDNGYLNVHFLPASHRISDSNREYFSESELELGGMEISFNKQTNTINLSRMTLYNSLSLVPWSKYTGGLSGGLRVGLFPTYDKSLNRYLSVNMEGKAGISWSVGKDIFLFTLAGIAYNYTANSWHGFSFIPEVGMVVNEVLNMKTVLRVSSTYNNHLPAGLLRTSLEHSLNYDNENSIIAKYCEESYKIYTQTMVEFEYRKRF